MVRLRHSYASLGSKFWERGDDDAARDLAKSATTFALAFYDFGFRIDDCHSKTICVNFIPIRLDVTSYIAIPLLNVMQSQHRTPVLPPLPPFYSKHLSSYRPTTQIFSLSSLHPSIATFLLTTT